MLLGRLLQLFLTMPQRTLRQQVDGLAATRFNPVNTELSVHEAEHLHPVQPIDLRGIATYHGHGLFLSFRHPGRSHLYTIDIEIAQQHTCNHQFLVRQETDTTCLLAIP